MFALINPNEQVRYVSSWNLLQDGKTYEPVYTYLNSRVCEVVDAEFPVASPLFWVDCSVDVNATTYYYNGTSIELIPVDATHPVPLIIQPGTQPQPTTTGTTTI